MEQEYTPQQDTSPEQKETGRIEAFSDGVFAVAVTLLILTIREPSSSKTDLPSFVWNQKFFFLAYVVSFITILVMWANHHGIFNLVVRADRVLTLLNGVLLMLITFVNYPTAIVAFALSKDVDQQRFAAMFYTGTLVVVTIVYQLFWRYIAGHRQLLDRHIDPRVVQRITREYRFGPLFYIVTFGVAYFNALAGILLTLLLAIYFGLTGRIAPVHSSAPSDHT